MSNQELDPPEVVAVDMAGHGVEILEPREVPLGGPRAMTVRRTLPQRARSLIGAWCFVDHYGPDDVTQRPNMDVPPHPHTGLQTVSWLFQGEIEHRDSLGSHAPVRPGELNLMTAGAGIAHSEVGYPTNTIVHGAQLWVALPDDARGGPRGFEHVVPEPVRLGAATVRVFIGELAGAASPARVFSPLVGAQVDVPAGETVRIPIEAGFEHGVLVDAGEITVDGESVPLAHLAYVAPGASELTIAAITDARLLLIGGAPFGEQIVMWWNFIGRSHEEIVGFRQQWQTEVIEGRYPDGRFGSVAGYAGRPLPAPELPTVRLKPRG
ncbi:pirin family protein [Leifsonia sp. H3M29-4]|uniref:pirin family protein n=1 Tax=Salinibacterium metalliresistens TaxID=3031321 RepID=UPI0023DAB5DF|nr:pirin family protein [Salinibacterium metalliresistens]MDF1477479.1 pirin family protein [Salinibacterium metalliresistens]